MVRDAAREAAERRRHIHKERAPSASERLLKAARARAVAKAAGDEAVKMEAIRRLLDLAGPNEHRCATPASSK